MNKDRKTKVAIIFGGKSGEHQVSVRSAASIEKYIDRDQFEVICIGISESGAWQIGEQVQALISNGKVSDNNQLMNNDKVLSDSQTRSEVAPTAEAQSLTTTQKALASTACDVIFPVIHGTFGEDGKLQGLLEMAGLPYVGSGVLGSSLSMDKVIQKQVCAQAHIPQTKFEALLKQEWQEQPTAQLAKLNKLSLPLFVKPANLGSSVGVTKVKSSSQLSKAVEDAFRYDRKVIVEEGIEDIVEIEVGVLGNNNPQVSVCGSLKPNTEFYDYATKYLTDDIEVEIPAKIPAEASDSIRKAAVETFKLLECRGLARIDFFYQTKTKKFFLNEVNTIPGFTSISMYPKLWQATGVSYQELITRLIRLAQEEWQEKQSLQYTFSPS